MAEQRLIDAEALYKKVLGRPVTNVDGYGYINHNRVLEMINNEPTVEAKPVVHAHWENLGVSVDGKRIYECTNCHSHIYGTGNFCKECGAQMDEEENDDG